NLEFSLPSILVQDVTPPRLLEQQNQFGEGRTYTIAFTEDIELAEGVTIEEFKTNVVATYTNVYPRVETLQASDNLWIEGTNVKLNTGDGILWRIAVQAVDVVYPIFPGGMLQDKAGNVIETAFNIPPLFLDAVLPVLGTLDYGEIHELDPFIEWSSSTSDIARRVGTNYELVQNISIAIDGGDPFSPIYATALGKLKVFLPPVFEGQEVEITLKEGQIVAASKYNSIMTIDLDSIANGEIFHTYTVKGHSSREVRTLAGFFISDDFEFRSKPFLTKHNKDDPRDQSGFFFDDPRGTIASFNAPMGIDIDNKGNIYVADLFNDRIRKITPRSEVTTAIGPRYGTSTIPLSGHFDESAALALLTHPTAVDVDSKGDIYVVDVFDTNESHSMVRKLSGGMVSTVADYSTVSFPHSYSGMEHFSKRGLEADWPDKIWVKASTQNTVGIYSIDKNDGASMEVLSENTISPMTDLQLTGNRIFATRHGGDIVEIKMENGVYTETTLIPVADIMTVLPQGLSIHSTALTVTEDGNTFYAAAFADNSLGYIIRVDYNS
ncbi:MAG: hypothetical protein AB2792_21515, partial [Candidatus Thiodiazotropha sp.]